MEDLTGQQIKGYTLLETIGAGGFGAVYRADQPNIGREVAIKIILPQYANHPDFIRRFEVEAQVIARLEHPHIIPLYDYWRDPDGAYIVMRYLRGGSLRTLLNEQALTLAEASGVLDQLAGALAVAHRHEVIHRDIKPDNILFDEDGNAYLTDFGIAKDLSSDVKVTGADMVVGSPAYLSPEQVRAEDVTARSDIYSLGILLYEMLTSKHPFDEEMATALLIKHLNDPLPPLKDVIDDVPEGVEKVIQRATAKDPTERYSDAPTLAAAFRQAVLLDDSVGTTGIIARPGRSEEGLDRTLMLEELDVDNPYKGLAAFEEIDFANFFGRDALIDSLLTKLRDQEPGEQFLAVIGPSGSGKSSVVQAGIIPRMRRGTLPGSSKWFVVEMLPGSHPLEELEAALLRIAVNPPPSLLTQLKEDERGLLRATKRVLPDEKSELFLFIDQFEEVFTQARDQAEITHFLNSIVEAVTDTNSALRVVITLRADFYDRPLLYPAFGDLVRRFTEVVLPMTPDELYSAIVGPAERVGVRMESGLANQIIADISQQPGALPLLQYALTELFDRREGRLLTARKYREIGGALGALARQADEIYEHLDSSQQELTRQLFLRMVTLGEGGLDDTRRRVTQSELISLAGDMNAMNALIDKFDKSRLLTFDHDPVTRDRTVEVAHEALIREWKQLQIWLSESREDLLTHRRLEAIASDWLDAGQDPSYLATGTRLEQFETWREDAGLALSQNELDYLDQSIARRSEQQALEAERQAREAALEQRSRSRLRALVVVMSVAAVIGLVLAGLAFTAQQEAVANAELASTAQANAEINRQNAEANAAEAVANANAAATAQAVAEANRLEAEFNAEEAVANANAAATAQAIAELNRVEAENNAQEARSLALAANARNLLAQNNPPLALALAIEAHNTHQPASAEVQQTLARAAYGPNARYRLAGHVGSVMSVATNGVRGVSVGVDNRLILWDLTQGTVIARHDLPVPARSVALSADGQRILTGLFNGDVVLWDAESGTELQRFSGHTNIVTRVVWGPAETRVLSASLDRSLRLWDTESGAALMTIDTPGALLNAAFSPDGSRAVSSSADATSADDANDAIDRTVRVWDLETGDQLQVFEPDSGFVRAIDFGPNGDYVLSGTWNSVDGGVLQLWNLDSGDLERAYFGGHKDVITQVRFSNDGSKLLSGSWDRSLVVWDAETGVILNRMEAHEDRIQSLDFGPDDHYVLVGTGNAGDNIPNPEADRAADTSVWLWDLTRSQAQLQVFTGHEDWVWSVAVSPDGKLAASGAGPLRIPPGGVRDASVRVWDLEAGAEIRRYTSHSDTVHWLEFMPDGDRLASASWDGTIRAWQLDEPDDPGNILFAGHEGRVLSVDFSPDGQLGLSSGNDGKIRLWDVATGEEIRQFVGHTGAVNRAVFSPDERWLASASSDQTVRLWNVGTGTELQTFTGHTGNVTGVAFNPAGTLLLSTSWDTTVRLWDVATGEEIRQFVGHNRVVYSPVFSPDGQNALTGSADFTVRLWDVATGEEIRRFEGHTNWVLSAVFSPDGTFIVTGAEDDTVRQWLMARSTDELIDWVRANRYVPALSCPERAQYRVEPLCVSQQQWIPDNSAF